ncbi:hypothetical protein OH460_08525 [Vibrio sp. Makdt]|uniref:hypothetical protein n=1 Tax=Vibrio sp. Makdt TaxID=2998828 RepID=UPI0022CD98E9|nr:hypothetical protein [Vibrio sp. Makdt]MDA0152345.1 hypothetical protein [Vibrio sp. Makdt]
MTFRPNTLLVSVLGMTFMVGFYLNIPMWDAELFLIGLTLGLPILFLWWSGRWFLKSLVPVVIVGMAILVTYDTVIPEVNRIAYSGFGLGIFLGVIPALMIHRPRSYLIISSFYQFDNNPEKSEEYLHRYLNAIEDKYDSEE